MDIIGFLGFIGLLYSNGLLGFTAYLVLAGFHGFTGFPCFRPVIDLKKCLEGLVKLVITSYRLGEMSGGFGENSYD